MTTYYNENNPHAAQWLRNLISAGLIPAGDVDARDIRDVSAGDLGGYDQCHFFAGIGLWPYALRLAGWPDDRPVHTGSCPCQPFSGAGKGLGFADERHLWPAWHWLIDQLRPDVIFGEQVADKDGLMWLDLVSSDLEACGYAIGSVDFPSAGVGAPNRRQRLYWVADTHEQRRGEARGDRASAGQAVSGANSADGGLADPQRDGRGAQRDHHAGHDRAEPDAAVPSGRVGDADALGLAGIAGEKAALGTALASGQPRTGRQGGGLGDAGSAGLSHAEPRASEGSGRRGEGRATEQSGGPLAPWREPEWVECTDGRRRPFEPGAFPLAPRHPGDVAKLRAYGNAINPVVAAEVIQAYLEARL